MSDTPATRDAEEESRTTATGSIEGKVTGPDDDPVDGADVLLRLSGSGNDYGPPRAITESDGTYLLDGLSPDDWDLRVEKASFDPAEKSNVTVESGLTTRVDFSPSWAFRKVIGTTDDPYGTGVFARNANASGWNYTLRAINDSTDAKSDAILAEARGEGDAVQAESRGIGNAVDARALGGGTAIRASAADDTGIFGTTDGGFHTGIVGSHTASSGTGSGIHGWTDSKNGDSAGVEGTAFANTGTPTGVRGAAASDGSAGVYGDNGASSGYAVFANGWLGVERDVRATGATNLGRHAATVVNTSDEDGADVLGLKMANVTDPGEFTNFVSFLDADSQLGSIEGSGGGVRFTGTVADFAEFFPKADPDRTFEDGEVVGLREGEVVAADADADAALVVSSAPLVLGNTPSEDGDREGSVELTLVGQTPVRVSSPVEAGDVLVASPDDDGTAVSGRETDAAARPVIGIALASHDGDDGDVLTLVGGPGVGATTSAGATPSGVEGDSPGGEADARRIATLERENDHLREQVTTLQAENRDLRERLSAVEDHLGLDDPTPTPADD